MLGFREGQLGTLGSGTKAAPEHADFQSGLL